MRTAEQKAKQVAKMYRFAQFNKNTCGKYNLNALLDFPVDNEDDFIVTFEESLRQLLRYPGKRASLMYEVMNDIYISENPVSAEDEAKALNVSLNYIYKLITEASVIIGAQLFKED